MESTIQLSEKNILKFKVKKENGEDTGLVIKIDLQDIELPLRINKMQEIHKKNVSLLRQKAKVLEKQEDKKGDGLLSWKQEEQIKLLDGNMTFSQMCEKGIIKPGMVMWFKKDDYHTFNS